MARASQWVVLVAIVAGLAGSLTFSVGARGQSATPVAAAATEPIELRVMTFNVWLGGVQVDLAQVVAAIKAARADVVGLQEVEGHTREIADALGWLYVDERLRIISRYPLLDPPGANGLYTFIEPQPGQVIAMANVHLPSDPYGPDAVLAGSTSDEVLALETETRLPKIEDALTRLPELVEQGIPVLVTGDFNSPSFHDGVCCRTVTSDPVAFPVEWPVSKVLADAGFQDSFRVAHPDATERPGITWTPGYPYPVIDPDVAVDRIDWVLAAGNVEVLNSEVVGEPDNSDVDIALLPWPSDHRGVVSSLRAVPGTPPYLVAVDERIVARGDEVIVRYHAPGEEGDRVALLPAGGDVTQDVLMSLPPQESLVDGAIVFGTATLAPGAYEASLLGADGAELARIPFWVQSPTAVPSVTPEKPVFAAGEPIVIHWVNAPGNKWDWIGIYAAGDSDLYNYLGFLYTEATPEGSVTFDAEALGEALLPGDYEARLMRDDGYVILAMAPFSVAAEA